MSIPRIIHLNWMQGWDNFPEKLKPNVESIISKNPGWKVMKWDESRILNALQGTPYLNTYKSFKLLHQRVDFARYVLLYMFGGVSLDTDIEALRPLSETPYINTSNFIVSEKPHSTSINNATILVSKENPIMKYVIDNIDTKECDKSDYKCIQATTGPYAFNRLISKFKDQIVVLDKSFLEPCTSLDPYCSPKEHSVLNHKHELSWISPWHKKAIQSYFIAKNFKVEIVMLIALVIILYFIFKK